MYKETVTTTEEQPLQNIETNSMVNVETIQQTKSNVTIRYNHEGVFKFTALARKAFAKGALISHNKEEMGAYLLAFHLKVSQLDDNEEIELLAGDVGLLREALRNRIEHCEKERDSIEKRRKQSFNPDTYISMKYLLLDLNLWLSSEIIEEEPVRKEAKTYTVED